MQTITQETEAVEKLETLAERDERERPKPIADRLEINGREVSEDEFLKELERLDDRRRVATVKHYAGVRRLACVARVVRRAARSPRRARVARAVVRVDADSGGDGPPPEQPCSQFGLRGAS